MKYKGIFNLYLVQNSHTFEKNKYYYPIIYHVVRLIDMKLIGGCENKYGGL
jgi:hypothetical protein